MAKKYPWQLTPLAVASIGAIDDFFDLYIEIQHIYDAAKDVRMAEKGIPYLSWMDWNRDTRIQVRKVTEPILIKYYLLFLDGTHKIHANAYGFARFNFIRTSPGADRYTIVYRYVSFADFLTQIQFAVSRIIYRWRIQDKPETAFETVCNEINDHVARYVESHSIVKTYQAENLTVQKPCSVLYTYKNLSSVGCRLKQHPVIATTCIADFASENGRILLPVHFCEECKKYFIGETTLALFEKNYGRILVKKRKLDSEGDFSNLNEESILFQYGYNVSDGQSEGERQRLLAALLDSKRISYLEMVRCIEFNIRMHPNHQEAVTKWKRDLKYISDYIVQKTVN